MTESSNSIDAVQWAFRWAKTGLLGRTELQLLQVLACHAPNVHPGNKLLLKLMGIKEPNTLKHALAALEQRGLISRPRASDGRVLPRNRQNQIRLHTDVEPGIGGGSQDPHGGSELYPHGVLTRPPRGSSEHPPEVQGKEQGLSGGRDRRTGETDEPPTTKAVVATLTAKLPEMAVAIGEQRAAITTSLEAYPEADGHDHKQAALVVTTWIQSGDMRKPVPVLLQSALRKQQQPEARGRRDEQPAASRPKRYVRTRSVEEPIFGDQPEKRFVQTRDVEAPIFPGSSKDLGMEHPTAKRMVDDAYRRLSSRTGQ